MGACAGIAMQGSALLLYNAVCRWQGCAQVPFSFSFWMIPFPVIVGIGTARAILYLPLGD